MIVSCENITMNEHKRITVQFPRRLLHGIHTGDSYAINGICLTVAHYARLHKHVTFEIGATTLHKTTAQHWKPSIELNVERALRLGERIGGHLIQGHVHAIGAISNVQITNQQRTIEIELPESCQDEVSPEGSIAIDGVSLTIAKLTTHSCSCALLPFTLAHTTLAQLQKGDCVNIECDFLLRHIKYHHTQITRTQ